ncbi:radical SAM/SPASM domain-containing protein [Candidatus Omnitrophota bacterium]
MIGRIFPYFSFGLNVFKANLNLLQRPYKLTFAVTYKCNGRCLTCDIWKRRPKDELSTEEIIRFFSKNNFFSWIDLTGGEIILRKDIYEIIHAIKKSCKDLFLLHFPTNAADPESVIKLCEFTEKLDLPKFVVSISFDGYPELYEKIRGDRDGCQKAIDLYKELKKRSSRKFGVYLGMTISNHNYNLINETVSWLRNQLGDFDISELHLNLIQNSSHYYGKTDNRDFGKIKESIGSIRYLSSLKEKKLDPVHFLERQYLRHVGKYLETRKTPLSCEALRSSIFLDPQGNVYACCCDDLLAGNIRERKVDYDLRALLSCEKAVNIREQIRKGNCAQCWTPCEAYQTILANLF